MLMAKAVLEKEKKINNRQRKDKEGNKDEANPKKSEEKMNDEDGPFETEGNAFLIVETFII